MVSSKGEGIVLLNSTPQEKKKGETLAILSERMHVERYVFIDGSRLKAEIKMSY